jgi:hypothetical protein
MEMGRGNRPSLFVNALVVRSLLGLSFDPSKSGKS